MNKKSFVLPLIIFLVLAGGLYYLLTNFQINLFSGEKKHFDLLYEKWEVKPMAYSLGDVVKGEASLDGKGWGITLGIVVGIPLIFALLSRFRIKRKARRKQPAAIHVTNQVHVKNETHS
jgi:hypothetical protein